MHTLLVHRHDCRVCGPVLKPSDRLAEEDLGTLKVGKDFAAEVKQPRSLQHHRLFFAMIRKVAQSTPTPLSEDALLQWIKVRCGHVNVLPLGFGKTYEAPASIAWHKGWLIGSRAGKHVCPACRGPAKNPTLSPAQRRAAYCRIEGVERAAAQLPEATPEPINRVMAEKLAPVLAVMTAQSEEPPMAAEPPRQPTQADNRRILDALTAHYDEEQARYRKAFSDDALAKQLAVPRAWVADVRERFYGPDVNEASAERDAKVKETLDLVEAAVKRLTEMALEAEQIGADLRSQTKPLLAKGVA